jgi:hypothetical protein
VAKAKSSKPRQDPKEYSDYETLLMAEGKYDAYETLAKKHGKRKARALIEGDDSDTIVQMLNGTYDQYESLAKSIGQEKAESLREYDKWAKQNPTDGYWGTGQSFLGGLSTRIIWRIIIAGVFFLILVIAGQR